jgi:hypothetical protein
MQRTFSKSATAGAAFLVIVGLSIVIRGDVALRQPTGFPQDWSHSHLIFANPGSFAQAVRNGSVAHWYKIMNDPRYQLQQLRRNIAAQRSTAAALKPTPAKSSPPKPAPPKSMPVAKDWNFDLWQNVTDAGVAPNMFPAKYNFNETGASCTGDFVIFGLWVGGSSTSSNLIGVDNLYVGAAEGGGCGTPSGSNGGSGTVPTPRVKWAFNVSDLSTGGNIPASVVLSLDGTKVAFVLNSTSGEVSSVVHVLTLGSGTYNQTTCGSGSTQCSITAPATPGSASAPGSSIATVTLSASGVIVNSSIYVDYGSDAGYVGDNIGHLYKISGLFHGTPALASSWTTNPVSAGTDTLTSPVYDSNTDTVFVASADGKLYGFNGTTGSEISTSPIQLAVSDGTSKGINAPPIVDSTNHVLYLIYGDNAANASGPAGCTTAGTCPEVAQVVYYDHTAGKVEFVVGSAGTPGSTSTAVAGTNLATLVDTEADEWILTSGAFSQSYINGFSSSTSFFYACGTNEYPTLPWGTSLEQFSFNSNMQLQSPAINVQALITATAPFGPNCGAMTEFYNGTTDRLFVGVPTVNMVDSINITSNSTNSGGSPPYGIPAFTDAIIEGGPSGIIVDGSDPNTNASSLYFTALKANSGTATCSVSVSGTPSGDTAFVATPANDGIGRESDDICAYKLTQSNLQ